MPTNCPAIISAYSNPCGDSQGGVQKFYITEHANIASYTEASGALTALTLNVGKRWYTYEQEINTANYSDDPNPNRQNGTISHDQTFNCRLLKRAAATSYALRALAHQNVAIITVDQTGTMWLLGAKNGLRLDPSKSGSGTSMNDATAYDLTFKGQEPYQAFTVSSGLISGFIV